MLVTNTQKEANQALYLRVRSAFVGQGTTLNAWCNANGVHVQNARAAFFGTWQGKGADHLVSRIVSASGADQK
jgi:hypothetical protein